MHNLLSSLNILLLAEDNLADARLVKEVMREGKFLATLHHVEDGVETMAFLRRQPPYQDKPRPDLLLLDLNMPRKDGWEVLEDIRADSDLSGLPVIIMTTRTFSPMFSGPMTGTPTVSSQSRSSLKISSE